MLIELKDGDTVIIGAVDIKNNVGYYTDMCNSLGRGVENVHFYYAPAEFHSVTVYRASPSKDVTPAEEHDGWNPWFTAPRDGQYIDVWADGYGRITDVFHRNDEWLSDMGDRRLLDRFDEGTKLYWRFKPKGPKA